MGNCYNNNNKRFGSDQVLNICNLIDHLFLYIEQRVFKIIDYKGTKSTV